MRQRIKVPYKLYYAKPLTTLHSLLGRDAKITSVKVNDVILADDTILVDVEYSTIPFNSMSIFYVPIKQLRPLIPNSTTYVAVINNHAVKVPLRGNIRFKDVLPLRVNKTITNNVVDNEQSEQQFAYFGTVVKNPLSHFCSVLKYPGFRYQLFESIAVDKLYPANFTVTSDVTVDKMLKAYMYTIRNIPSLNFVNEVVPAKTVKECTENNKGYLIEWSKMRELGEIRGVIVAQPERLPFSVVFIPSQTYKLMAEEVNMLNDFLEMENANYLNYEYMTGEKV
jgi:hypothetical protein